MIDFQGGSHGNYLEFVCNTLAGVAAGLPFNANGAAHSKKYLNKKVFEAQHYSFTPVPFISKKVISIQIDTEDLLPFQQISLLRAGDIGLDNNVLEIDTYNKLNNKHYRWVLDKLVDGFFKDQIKNSYDAVRDESWPVVNTKEDYYNLPQWIRDECETVHNLKLLTIDKQNPDCPRSVLREFFKIGFLYPENHGFIAQQKLIQYPDDFEVFVFPFGCFYNTQKFLDHVEKIACWADLQYNCQSLIEDLHKEFLKRQPYCDSKNKCDRIAEQIIANKYHATAELTLLEEAYINSKLDQDWFV